MEQSEYSQEDIVTATKTFKSSQSDQAEKKKSFWIRVKACFRCISLGEYRTPMYFDNKDSYKSATSGFLTLLLGLTLAVICFFIFMPIFMKEMYNSEIKQIKLRGEYKNGTVESCTSCTNLTVREALKYMFNGNQYLRISSNEYISIENCNQYQARVRIIGLDSQFKKRFNQSGNSCGQSIFNDEIIMFLEEEKMNDPSIPLIEVLDSPAIIMD
jgi:hypothetical protein